MINSNSTQFNNEIYTKRMQTMKHDGMYICDNSCKIFAQSLYLGFASHLNVHRVEHLCKPIHLYLNIDLNLHIFLCGINQCFRMSIYLVCK